MKFVKSKVNLKYFLIFILIIIFLVSFFYIFDFKPNTYFPGEVDSGVVAPKQTKYQEGEKLELRLTNPYYIDSRCESGDITGWAIWIDGKKYECQERCASPFNFCCDYTLENPDKPNKWGFDFGSVELDSGLQPSIQLVEGWVHAFQGGPGTGCPAGGAHMNSFFSFEINVEAEPCILGAGEYLAQISYGPGAVYDINDLVNYNKLCSKYPTIIIDKRTLTIYNDYTIKTKLENLQTIIVPDNKIYIQFWVSDNPLAECEEGLMFDENVNKCLAPGTITYCAAGNWVDGSCVVTLITQCNSNEDCIEPCPGMTTKCESKDAYTNICKYYGECMTQPPPILSFWEKLSAIWNSFLVWLSNFWT